MSILEIILILQVFVANKIYIVNEISNIEGDNKLIEKFIELKIKKLFKSQKLAKLKKKLTKIRNSPNFKAKKKDQAL